MRATLTDPKTQQRIRFDKADLVALLAQLSEAECAELRQAVDELRREKRNDLFAMEEQGRATAHAANLEFSRLTPLRQELEAALERAQAGKDEEESSKLRRELTKVRREQARLMRVATEAQGRQMAAESRLRDQSW